MLSGTWCWSTDDLYLLNLQFRTVLLYLDMRNWWVVAIGVIWGSSLKEFLVYHWLLAEKFDMISLWDLWFDLRLGQYFRWFLFNDKRSLATLRLASLEVSELLHSSVYSFLKGWCRIQLCSPTTRLMAWNDPSGCLLVGSIETDSFFLQVELELPVNSQVVLWKLHNILALRD